MNWQNLKTNNCPHCMGNLLPLKDGFINCEQCRFKIDEEKMKAIMRHRGGEKPALRFKWQNLLESRCPICGSFLMDGIGPYAILNCSNHDCAFHIREDRLEEIIQDKNHPANRFYQKIEDDIDANLAKLNNL